MKTNIRSQILAVAIASTFAASAFDHTYNITIENPLKTPRTDCPVELSLSDLAPGEKVTAAVLTIDGKEIPIQLDDLDGDGTNDWLAFTVDIGSKEKLNLQLLLSDNIARKEYPPRTWAGFMLVGRKKGITVDITDITVPGTTEFYNMVHGHGPMFESELAAYRVYFNQKQTLDPYGKKHPGLELADTKFYPDDNQIASGYGDDVLLAGNSCGVGAFKGWDGEKTTHIEPVGSRRMRVVSSGPVRAVVEVEVRGWKYGDRDIDLTNRYVLYAGHRDVRVESIFGQDVSGVPFATGVQNIPGDNTSKYSDHKGLVGSWGTHWPMNDTVKYAKETIGIATFVPKEFLVEEAEDADNFLYLVTPAKSSPDKLHYYTMFTAAKEEFGYGDKDTWFAYLPEWRRQLEHPLRVTVLR